jgi:hypothetical protein
VTGAYGVTLDELIDRLSTKAIIDGLAVVGSGADGTMNPASDHDLLIVLDEPQLQLVGGVTEAEGRMVDIGFSTVEEIDELLKAGDREIPNDGVRGSIVRSMGSAIIGIDRHGRLNRLKEKALSGFELAPPSDGYLGSRWDKASYNLAHTQKMLASEDPVYLEAIDLRLLYQLSDLMLDYFAVRGLPRKGEKAAIRYWRSNDEVYYSLFRECLEENDRARKVDLYGQLATATMAPVGPLWRSGDTRFRLSPESEMTSSGLAKASEFWSELID